MFYNLISHPPLPSVVDLDPVPWFLPDFQFEFSQTLPGCFMPMFTLPLSIPFSMLLCSVLLYYLLSLPFIALDFIEIFLV